MLIKLSSLLLLALVTVCACSRVEPHAVMKDYDVGPTPSEMRLYHYHRYPENDTLFILFAPVVEQGEHYVIESCFTHTMKVSTRKLRISNGMKELVEQWYYNYPDPSVNRYDSLKAEIIEYAVVDEDKKFPGGQYYFRYKLPGSMISGIKVREIFERDTVYTWNGEILPAIKFRDEYTYETSHRFMPFSRQTVKLSGVVYFAQGIGIVRFFAYGDGTSYGSELFKVDIYNEHGSPIESTSTE